VRWSKFSLLQRRNEHLCAVANTGEILPVLRIRDIFTKVGNICGIFIPDPDFVPLPDPGVKKHQIPDPQHWLPLGASLKAIHCASYFL
jgi:hypothetical protein